MAGPSLFVLQTKRALSWFQFSKLKHFWRKTKKRIFFSLELYISLDGVGVAVFWLMLVLLFLVGCSKIYIVHYHPENHNKFCVLKCCSILGAHWWWVKERERERVEKGIFRFSLEFQRGISFDSWHYEVFTFSICHKWEMELVSHTNEGEFGEGHLKCKFSGENSIEDLE